MDLCLLAGIGTLSAFKAGGREVVMINERKVILKSPCMNFSSSFQYQPSPYLALIFLYPKGGLLLK
jgi:hypothetical protein